MPCEKKTVFTRLAARCPYCDFNIIIDNLNATAAKRYMSKPHEYLNCLKYGTVYKRMSNASVIREFKFKRVGEKPEAKHNSQETKEDEKKSVDLLLQLKCQQQL
jgi:hypothetical protein